MGNVKKIVCDICGSTAYVPTIRRYNYCNNPNCKAQILRANHLKAQRKYDSKRSVEKTTLESKPIMTISQTKVPKIIKPASEIKPEIKVKNKVNTEALDNIEIYDIREIARELGTIRFKLIEMYQKEDVKIKELEKGDLTLLHAFELESLTKDEVYEYYLKSKTRRTTRRGSKDRKALISILLNSILIKNPDKFIVKAINNGKLNKDFNDVVDELKKDDELYVQAKQELKP